MNTFSGLSFYDSLNKLTVGVLILFPFVEENTLKTTLFYIAAFIFGCIYQWLMQSITRCWLSQNSYELKIAYQKVHTMRDYIPQKIKYEYVRAYYNVAQEGLLMNIPVLEALENFMRNMVLIILFYLIALLAGCANIVDLFPNTFCGALVISSLFICIVLLRCYYQQELYKLVWEGDKYLFENKS